MDEFREDSLAVASLVVSIYVLGYVFGPLIIAPASELYGRLPVYHVNTFLFLAFSIGCSRSTSISMLIVFRFFAGVAGSCPITVGSGTIADTFKQEHRGKVMSIWSFPILFGPRLVLFSFLLYNKLTKSPKSWTCRRILFVGRCWLALGFLPNLNLRKTALLVIPNYLLTSLRPQFYSCSRSFASERRTHLCFSNGKPRDFEKRLETTSFALPCSLPRRLARCFSCLSSVPSRCYVSHQSSLEFPSTSP